MDLKRPHSHLVTEPAQPDKKPRPSSPVTANGVARSRRSGSPTKPKLSVDEDEDEDEEMDSLTKVVETFRKEAIYRQMLEYKRMNSRSAARVQELERRKTALQAGLQGIEVCWTELLETVKGIVGASSVPSAASVPSNLLPEGASAVPELTKAVDQRSQSTKELLLKFVELSERGVRASQDELRERCGSETKRNSSLQSSLHILQSQLAAAKEDQERTYGELVRAEKKLDRLRSQSITGQAQAQPPPPAGPTGSAPSGAPTPTASAGGDVEMKDASSAAASPSATAGLNGSSQPTPAVDPSSSSETLQPSLASLVEATLPDPEDRALADSRLLALEKMREEKFKLEFELDRLRLEVDHPPEATVTGTAVFQVLLGQLEHYRTQASRTKDELERVVEEADGLRDGRKVFETSAVSQGQVQVDTLRTQLSKREQDLGRLRGERDDLMGKLNEKKAKEAVKVRHVEEAEAMVKSTEARMESLKSDVARLKSRLAAESGSESIFTFLLKEVSSGEPSEDYVKTLESTLASAEARINSLTDQVAQFASDPTVLANLQADSQARQDLSVLQAKLDRFEKLLGPDPGVGEEAAKLLQSVQDKQALVDTLERKLKENEMATDALYLEVERLSAAWEEANAHVHKKVFGLKEMEEKLGKALNEKAKADNKYFAAMRAKDALEGEKKVIARNNERQLAVLEKFSASEKSLNAQLAAQDQQVTLLQRQLSAQVKLEEKIRLELSEKLGMIESESRRTADLEKQVHSKTIGAKKDAATVTKLEEELAKSKRDAEKAEKALAKMKSAVSSAAASGTATIDPELQEERDKLYSILRCSTCSNALRTHCITKCMHTFCKECIDTRIQTRQRKCPACNLPFAVSDVAQVYFQ